MLGDRPAAPIQRVRGTSDVLPPHDARLRQLETVLRDGFERFGYQGIQTPILEPLELFLRKSGDDIVARMYAFAHWNRKLCLRPELTASVMRAFVDSMQGQSLPLRLHYAGPSFRYERPSRGRSRQFTQVGLELIGAAGAASDAEVLHLACAGLESVGITSYRLVVGHLSATLQLLAQLGLSDHAQGLVLDQMEPIARGRIDTQAACERVIQLLGGPQTSTNGSAESSLHSALANLPNEQAAGVAADILSRASLPVEGGSRNPRQIIERLLAKARQPDPTAGVRAAFEFAAALHAAAGPPEGLADRLRPVLQTYSLNTGPLDEIAAALKLVDAYGPIAPGAQIQVDLSLARGLRYYTGLVFEIYVDTEEGPLQICGGGRYDDLVRALGGREVVPACGFMYGLERVDLVRDASAVSTPGRQKILVVGVQEADYPAAVRLAAQLRALPDVVVEQDVRLRGVKSALRYADRAHVDLTVIVGERERQAHAAVVRDMRSRDEVTVAQDELLSVVQETLRR